MVLPAQYPDRSFPSFNAHAAIFAALIFALASAEWLLPVQTSMVLLMASADIFPVTGRNADAADVIKGALDATEKVIEMLIKGIIEHETRLRAIEVRLAIQPQSEPETPN